MREKELVVKAKAGDAKAFTELYGLYKKKLYSYVFRIAFCGLSKK